mmetsp:Transcript_10679/g.15629  ORF Transcript_10679/g.15629 Transcript_10679/m.15629 type:complete len:249 (-) Transcript_10679:3-749(-)
MEDDPFVHELDARILYICISYSNVILADYSSIKGNFRRVIQDYIPQLPNEISRFSFRQDDYMFHVDIDKDGICKMALSDLNFSKLQVFKKYFMDIQKDIFEEYRLSEELPGVSPLEQFSYQKKFKKKLKSLTKYYNENIESDPIRKTQVKLQTLQGEVQDNVTRLLQRGSDIDVLSDRVHGMEDSSMTMNATSAKLARQQKCKKILIISLIIFVILSLAVILSLILCGPMCTTWFFDLFKKKTEEKKE